jgi:hypothetical protein
MHQVSKFLFCHEILHVSGIYCAHHQELSAVRVAIGMFNAGYVAAASAYFVEPYCRVYPVHLLFGVSVLIYCF